MDGPRWVAADDRKTRRRAAGTVGLAFLNSPISWCFRIPAVVLLRFVISGIGDAEGTSFFWMLFGIAAMAGLIALGGVAPLAAWEVYRAPVRARPRRLAYLGLGGAEAAMVMNVQPAGEWEPNSLGAWPKRQGAGRQLGEWVKGEAKAAHAAIVCNAMPGVARVYKKHGMVEYVDAQEGWRRFIRRVFRLQRLRLNP